MTDRIDDLRIAEVRPLIPAAILIEELPLTEGAASTVGTARKQVSDSFYSKDPRLVVVVGPCSIHDPVAAVDYAEKLKAVADRLSDDLLVVMRTYFEKPRTTVGWKGFVNDPFLDGSFKVNEGLRIARRLLRTINEMGLPTATEFLDTTLPQHLADFISWGAIGARTTESQTHREMASGLSMPIGFKNATDGSVRVAIDAVVAAIRPHWFAGATKDGVSALIRTTGNDSCHVILRGGSRTGPNYGEEFVMNTSAELIKDGLVGRLMVDCSHGNSEKNYLRQLAVVDGVIEQIEKGRSAIFGVMLESHLVSGQQNIGDGKNLVYGQSITDACLSFDETVPVLEKLARATRKRTKLSLAGAQ